jgi:RHS repeat-associated protein
MELDSRGQIISYEEYYPYGSTSYQAGRSAAEVSGKRYRYAGMERDQETGLACHGVRYYAHWLGRWTSADPSALAGGMNAYLYCAASPTCHIDVSGLAPKKYQKQRGKDTAAKQKEFKANQESAKQKGFTRDPMQQRAEKLAKTRGKTPIEHHHHQGVKQAAEVKLAGTLRTFNESVREDARTMMKQTLAGCTATYGATYSIEYVGPNYPLTFNDPALTAESLPQMERVLGKGNIVAAKPITGSEDFSYYQKVIPGFFWFLGGGNAKLGITAAHHTPDFNIDEAALVPGVKLAANQLLDYLDRHK